MGNPTLIAVYWRRVWALRSRPSASWSAESADTPLAGSFAVLMVGPFTPPALSSW
jgi:hypothetical protein